MLLAQDVLTLLAGPMAAAGASNCNITGAWCDVLGRCRTAAIDIRAAHCGGGAGCAIGCEGSPFGWGLVAEVPGRHPALDSHAACVARNGSVELQLSPSARIVGTVDTGCDHIRFAGTPAFAPKGWCRQRSAGCAAPTPPAAPPPIDRAAFTINPAAATKRLERGFWNSQSWQPSNYPASRFLLAPGDPLLAAFPFAAPAPRAPGAWRGPQVSTGFTNIVRGLGGWGTSSWCGPKNGVAWTPHQTAPCAEYDVAYRADNGSLAYRWHLLHARVGPVVASGSTPELGLGNVPYAFVNKSSQAAYGQCQPPDDLGEWSSFVTATVRELVRVYGETTVLRWRFRIGTEENAWDGKIGIAHLCWHNVTNFLEWYDHTAAAVLAALPGAVVGPGNFGAMGTGAEV